MKWRPYKDYKGTDIPGLEQIPAHWEVRKLKLIANVRGGVAKGKDLAGQETVRVPYLRVANVQDGYLNLAEVEEIDIPERELDRYLLQPGDVLMNEGGDFDKLGRGCVWKGEVAPCIHQNHVFSVRPRRVRSEWLSAVSGSAYAQFFFMGRAKQSTNLASISATNLAELPVVMPPTEEQDRILAFLDHETVQIDALIAEQRTLIERLTEQRKAVITHATCLGTRAEAAIAETGNSWVPEVPSHWRVDMLKRHWTVTDCKHYTVQFLDEGRPVVSISELAGNRLCLTDAKKTSKEEFEFLREGRVPRAGDVILCRNASVGTVAYIDSEVPFCLGQDVCLLSSLTRDNKFLYYCFLSNHVQEQLNALMVGATFKRINIEQIRELWIGYPPEKEQSEICKYLDHETYVFDKLKCEAEASIALLLEHRSALTTAAVTGRVDVLEVACV